MKKIVVTESYGQQFVPQTPHIYVISDIHGEYDLLCALLKKVNFCAQDTLIVAGDMIDKGPNSVKVVQMLRNMTNAMCILGNHEYDFLKLYHALMQTETTDYGKVFMQLQKCFADGELLTWEDVDWLETLPNYAEYDNFFVAHSGLPQDAYGNFLSITAAPTECFVYNRFFNSPTCLPQGQKCCIFGHTPVRYTSGNDEIIFYPRSGNTHSKSIADYVKIHIDTGVYLGGILGCLCIDDLQTFYVKK